MPNFTDTQSARFSMIETDFGTTGPITSWSNPPVIETPVIDVITRSADGSSERGGSAGVSTLGKLRAMADEATARANGFSPAAPVYEIGSKVNATGVGNFRAMRAQHDAKAGPEALDKLIDIVDAEKRHDLVVPIRDLKMFADGRMSRGGGLLGLSERAMTGLGTFVTPGGAGYLSRCSPELRAVNVNAWIATHATPAPGAKPAALTLRTRINAAQEKREISSIVGKNYKPHDANHIARLVRDCDAIPAGAKYDVIYDGYKTKINITYATDVQPENAVAGEIFRAGISVTTADDGTGATIVSAFVERNLCLNLIVLDLCKQTTARKRHSGTNATLNDIIAKGLHDASGKVVDFAKTWGAASVENVIEKYGVGDVSRIFQGLIYNKLVSVPGVSNADMMDRLTRAYQCEPGHGKTAIVNAVTRAAHENEWARWSDVESMEHDGSALLFAKNWNLGIPDAELESLEY